MLGPVGVAVVATVATAISDAGYSIASDYWLNGPVFGYGVTVIFSVFTAVILTGVCVVLYAIELSVSPHSTTTSTRAVLGRIWGTRRLHVCVWLSGFCLAIMLLLSSYSSAPDRTAPILQSLLPAVSPLFVIPLSIWLLGDRKPYCTWMPAVGMTFIILSAVIAVLPMVVGASSSSAVGGDLSPGQQLAWAAVYAGSYVPSAVGTVLQQVVLLELAVPSGSYHDTSARGLAEPTASTPLINTDAAPVFTEYSEHPASATAFDRSPLQVLLTRSIEGTVVVSLTTWTTVVGVLAACWLDFIPWLGSSDSAAQFSGRLRDTVSCSLQGGSSGVAGCTNAIPSYVGYYLLAYTVNMAATIALTWSSAVYAQVASTAGSAVQVWELHFIKRILPPIVALLSFQAIIWLIPAVNGSFPTIPLWASLPSMACALIGLGVWKAFETRHGNTDAFSVSRQGSCHTTEQRERLNGR
jgi:hypothetical protein